MIVPLVTGSHSLHGLWACAFICCWSTHPWLCTCSVALYQRSQILKDFFFKKISTNTDCSQFSYVFSFGWLRRSEGKISLFHLWKHLHWKDSRESNFTYCENMQIKVYNSYINIIQCVSLMTQIQKFFAYIIIYCARTTMTKIIIFWLSLSFNSQSHLFT